VQHSLPLALHLNSRQATKCEQYRSLLSQTFVGCFEFLCKAHCPCCDDLGNAEIAKATCLAEAPMKRRKLRIVWSVAWGIVAVLLVVLWVRNYWYWDIIAVNRPAGIDFVLASYSGCAGFAPNDRFFSFGFTKLEFIYHSGRGTFSPSIGMHTVRYSLLSLAAGLAAGVSWLRWHFSLRTLLIATTFVAVGLGLIVWLR
jgi:hypothetical protein